jgi:hypothetical protein
VVIERMHKQHGQSRPEMQCALSNLAFEVALTRRTGLEMDVRKLDFEDSSFDVAIDKGTSHFHIPKSI